MSAQSPAMGSSCAPVRMHALMAYARQPFVLHRRPWTTADDKLLRMLVAKHSTRNDVPWGTISLKGNFGHNSGSCKKRYEQLPSLKHPDASVFVFANGGVTAKTMEWD